MCKARGFLIAEACVALLIAVLSISTLYYCVAQTKQAQITVENRLARSYAQHVFRHSSQTKLQVRGQIYRKAGTNAIPEKSQ